MEFLYLSTVLIISTTKRTLPCTIDSQYIAVIYHTIMHTAQQLQWYFGQICTHERHSIPSPNGWDMGWVSFMSYTKNNYRNISRTHWVANSTGYDLCWMTCHKQSLFSSVSKKQYTSHELTWWYWHIHVTLWSILFKVLSALIFFPKFKENKDFSNISTKMEIFMKISKKIQESENFLKFSCSYIHLAHFESGCCWWSGAKIC